MRFFNYTFSLFLIFFLFLVFLNLMVPDLTNYINHFCLFSTTADHYFEWSTLVELLKKKKKSYFWGRVCNYCWWEVKKVACIELFILHLYATINRWLWKMILNKTWSTFYENHFLYLIISNIYEYIYLLHEVLNCFYFLNTINYFWFSLQTKILFLENSTNGSLTLCKLIT